MLELLESRRAHYLLAALLRIAASDRPVSGKALAEQMRCPRRYLEPDLQALTAAGVLESRRGAGGGYRLAMNPHRVSLELILRCMDAREPPLPDDGGPLLAQVARPVLDELRQTCREALTAVTLADCLDRAQAAGLLDRAGSAPNFSI